jgi:hypothetical protein
MKALLINGPRHLTTLRLGNFAPMVIFIPKPMPANLMTAFVSMDGKAQPEFETVIYRKQREDAGGFALYVADEDETCG